MKELPVEKCIGILNIFYAKKNEELWPNKIVKEIENTTGSKDKPAIINAIRLLEKALLIKTERTQTTHKQKEIKVLTQLGLEILNFIEVFEKSHNSYTKLKDTIIEYNLEIEKDIDEETEDNIVKNKLRIKGWHQIEIESFESIMRSAFKMETFYRKNILTFLLNRYSGIISKHYVTEITNKIILKLIMSKIEKVFLLVKELKEVNDKYIFNPNYYFNVETEVEEILPFVDNSLLLIQDITQLYYYDFNLLNTHVANNIDELTLSMFLLVQPPIEDIQIEVTEMAEIIENKTQDIILAKLRDNNKNLLHQDQLIDDLGVIKLINICKKYLKLREVLEISNLDNKV